MLRHHRVWAAEAIVGDRAVAEKVLEQKYPEFRQARSPFPRTKAPTAPDVMEEELKVLKLLDAGIRGAWEECPPVTRKRAFQRWLSVKEKGSTNLEVAIWLLEDALQGTLQEYPQEARPTAGNTEHLLFKIETLQMTLGSREDPPADWLGPFLYESSMKIKGLA